MDPGPLHAAKDLLEAAPSQDGRTSCAAPTERLDDPRAPIFSPADVIAGRYKVVRFIARGGMGEVYEVDDLELKRGSA